MARKKFVKEIKGIDALFSDEDSNQEVHNTEEDKSGFVAIPRAKNKRSSSKKPLEKISFNLDIESSEKIKAFAFNNRIPITEILKKCVEEYLSKIPQEDIEQSLKVYRNAN